MAEMPDTAGMERRLAEVRAKRGYLLPHHGMLAIAAPGLLAGYDAAYTALALTPRIMAERPKEFIWLAVLTACDEGIATHHIAKFRNSGGTDAEIELAVRLAAFAEGASRSPSRHGGTTCRPTTARRPIARRWTPCRPAAGSPAGWSR